MEQYLTRIDYALWDVIINGDSPVPEPPAVAIPDEHLLKLHLIKDAKSLWEAIKIRFGRNKDSKKMHKTILKQQYENFVASRSEGLDKTYDRFQKLISQLELNGQSSSGSNSHNVAFVSSKNTTSINETVTAAHDIPAVGSKEQPSASSYADDVAMITMRVKKFMKRTWKNLNFNGKEPVGFYKTKGECYNCHRRGNFAREYRAPMNQGNRSADNERRVIPVETLVSALVVQEGSGRYDWIYQAKKGPTDFALMAHFSDSVNLSNSEKDESSKMTHPHLRRNFVPTTVATKSGQVLVNAARQNSAASTSTTRPKATAKVNKDNDQEHKQALVDKTKVIITEDIIRSDLRLDDAEGTATVASAIICLADNQKFNFSKYIFNNPVKSLEGGVNFYLFLRFLQVFLDKQVKGMARHKELYIISSHTKKIFTNIRRIGACISEDASKQGRMVEEINQNAKIALDDETQGRKNDDEMFGVDDLVGEEVVMDSATKLVTTVKDSVAPTTDVIEDKIIMAQTLAALKSVKPKVVVQEHEMSTIILAAATKVTTDVPTPRAKVPLKKKDQISFDEEYAKKLQGEEQEATRLSRAQQDKEAWDNIQAMMDVDRLLAERLQARERKELFEGRIFDEIKELFDREMRKKQKVDENVEQVVANFEEHRKCIEILPNDGDEVLVEATPISSRSPTIIDYKIYKAGKKTYFKIIRVNGNSQVYQTFEKMFKSFNKEDLDVL
nr:hypothetical protein [Tanacetum cinerariifolium]